MLTDRSEDEEIRALIIADSIAQAEEFQTSLSKSQCKGYVKLIYPSAISKEKASIEVLFKDCKHTVDEDGDIDAILTANKEYALLQSILVKELNLPKQKVPSFESLVICLHKYYTNQRLLRGFNFTFKSVEIDDAEPSDIEAAVDETGEPALLTDAIATQGAVAKKISAERLSIKEIESIRKSVSINFDKFKDLFEKYTPSGKENYPYIFEPICLVNEYWKAYDKDVTFHQAECCVSTNSITEEQELVPWTITDLVYCKGKRRSLMYVGLPSQIPSDTNVWAVLREIYGLLVGFGFRDYFFNAIVVASANGDVKIADINSGILKENTELYKHVLLQGDNLKAMINAGLGKMQRTPKDFPNRYAMRADLRTYVENSSVEEVIDLKAARSYHNVELHVHNHEQSIVHDSDEGGMLIASVYLTGTNHADCIDAFSDICEKILKTKGKMNWNFDMLPRNQ